jgi:hypothetical protein
MPLITFAGATTDATGNVTLLSIGGPDHFSFSKKYTNDFSEPLNLDTGGVYFISVSVFTDGDFTFDVQGKFTSITPKVPDDYNGKKKEVYTLTI